MDLEQKGSPEFSGLISEDKIISILDRKIKAAIKKALPKLLVPAAKLEELKRKEFLTEQEVGTLYSISPASIRSERSRGLGPAYIKDGRRVLYPRQELEKYFEMRIVKTAHRH